jgi:hypothetical protein
MSGDGESWKVDFGESEVRRVFVGRKELGLSWLVGMVGNDVQMGMR